MTTSIYFILSSYLEENIMKEHLWKGLINFDYIICLIKLCILNELKNLGLQCIE